MYTFISRLSADISVHRLSTDTRPIYRPTVGRCISRYVHIYRSTVGRYIGPLSAVLSVDYRPIVGRLSTDSRPIVGRLSTEATYSTHDPERLVKMFIPFLEITGTFVELLSIFFVLILRSIRKEIALGNL